MYGACLNRSISVNHLKTDTEEYFKYLGLVLNAFSASGPKKVEHYLS